MSDSHPSIFLEKLNDILDENLGFSEFISWQPNGKSFLIKDAIGLSRYVLPQYFKHNNLQSFIRQLNMYCFRKTNHDSNHREFQHEHFQKNRKDLLHLIKRKSQKLTPMKNILQSTKHDDNSSFESCKSGSNEE